jgi:hypothetical protein
MFNFELHGEDNEGQPLTTDDGKPLMVTKRYTRSFFETSALRQDLQAWRGKEFTADELQGFDITVLLGKFCMINVIHNKASNGKTYANVKGLSPVPAAMKKLGEPKGVNDTFIFDLNAFDQAKFDTLPQWLQDTIKESAEYRGTVASGNPAKVLQDIYNYAKGKKPHDYHNLLSSSDQITAKFDAWQEIECKIEELLQTTPTKTQPE